MKCNFLLASAFFIATALWVAPAQGQQKTESKKSALTGSLNVMTDTNDGSGETNIDYADNGHRYKIKLTDSKITEMSLDGKRVPPEEFSKYDPLVKKILAQIERDREQARRDRVQAEQDREQAMRDREQAMKDRQQAERDREQAGKDREQADEQRQNLKADRQRMDNDRAQAAKNRKQAERDREQAKKDRAQAELDRAQAAKDRKQADEDRELFEAMLDELVKEKVVASRDEITSLALDDTKLTVNGQVQPESLHGRFKSNYLKGTHKQINYSRSGQIRHMSVD